jgi:hypothetical protein
VGECGNLRERIMKVPHGKTNERDGLETHHLIRRRRAIYHAPTFVDERARGAVAGFCLRKRLPEGWTVGEASEDVAPFARDPRKFVEDSSVNS